MTITAAIITSAAITTLTESADCLLDAMVTAQNILGQITWTELGEKASHGTYRTDNEDTATVSVVDTSATAELRGSVETWMHNV